MKIIDIVYGRIILKYIISYYIKMDSNNTINRYKLKKENISQILVKHGREDILEELNGIGIWVGTNASSNWEIYRASGQIATIFHLDKFSSPYVIVNRPVDQLNNNLVWLATIICKSRSKYKNVPNIGVSYTSMSNTYLGSEVGSFIIKNQHKKKVVYL